MKDTYMISMVTENKIRVLQRIAGILARNRLNIIHMNVQEMSGEETSQLSLTFESEEKTTMRVVQQLKRMIELLEINVSNQAPKIQQFP
ncbi:MAG: hypothetical protein K0Q74_107 [Gammaproteobacteria bacterium]|jgi:acetolactate synthase small subunit|nr:hypothetical protein [Gammaproteobacteria bacterium]